MEHDETDWNVQERKMVHLQGEAPHASAAFKT